MNNSQAILDKILADAQKIADTSINAATEKAEQILASAQKEIEELNAKVLQENKQAFADCVQRRVMVANIDAKKIILDAKTQVIDLAFDKARDKIVGMDTKSYLKFIDNILSHGAQDGDVVVIAKTDKDRITQEFIDNVAKRNKIKLTLSKTYGDFKGGCYIESKSYDKNYTVESEIFELKEQLIGDIAKIIFKE